MKKINAQNMHFSKLNSLIRECADSEITLENVCGQRFIASGESGKTIDIYGIPGNALCCYFDGGKVIVHGNAQDATGDTMNDGTILIHGSSGDATGYAMRGGKILVKGNAGYRAGIHMKAYKEKQPKLVIGGKAGDFLGEYLAGGTIVVLGIGVTGLPVGNFCGTGMHGGKMFICSDEAPYDLPKQVITEKAGKEDLFEIEPLIKEYCEEFGGDVQEILSKNFFLLTPNTKNPYKQLYTHN